MVVCVVHPLAQLLFLPLREALQASCDEGKQAHLLKLDSMLVVCHRLHRPGTLLWQHACELLNTVHPGLLTLLQIVSLKNRIELF